jgi:hypothetical protein
MGVNTFLLGSHTATLIIGGKHQVVGTLRRFFKLTEMNDERAAELNAAAQDALSPPAALLLDITELPLADELSNPVAAHLVIGWDEGRSSVTDFGWDYLPRLGYAVRDQSSGNYILYEERTDRLHSMNLDRARSIGLLDEDGQLIRHGQPRIAHCYSVRPFIRGYAEAKCVFDNGTAANLIIPTRDNEIPRETWLIGKRPMDVQENQRKNREA